MLKESRVLKLESRLGGDAPLVIIAFSHEEADELLREFRKKFPRAAAPVVLLPDPLCKQESKNRDYFNRPVKPANQANKECQ